MDTKALVAEIDAEIDLLQKTRALLTGHTAPLKRERPPSTKRHREKVGWIAPRSSLGKLRFARTFHSRSHGHVHEEIAGVLRANPYPIRARSFRSAHGGGPGGE